MLRYGFSFSVWNGFFYLSRLGTIILSAVTFIVGLGSAENKGFDLATGNFNTFLIRWVFTVIFFKGLSCI